MLLRDNVIRCSTKSIRAAFPPRVFAQLQRVRLACGPADVYVDLVRTPGRGCITTTRVWLRCPLCDGLVQTIGFDVTSGNVGCRRCLGWRGSGKPIDGPFSIAPHAVGGAGLP